MGVHESRGNLAKAWKELMLRWGDARASWDDVRAEEFEKQYLLMLEGDLKAAARSRSAPRMATCTCRPNVLLRQAT